MDNRRKVLSLFKPPTRMTRILVEELKRCWAKLDGRAATIRRLQAVCDRLRRDRDQWRDAAIDDLAEINRLERENHRQRVKLANRGSLIVELWQSMEAARRWIKGEFRDELGDPASKSWACLWCGEMLTGREHAKEHCHHCPESPLVKRIQELERKSFPIIERAL